MKVTYDTGALIAAERNDRRMWALHDGYNAEGVTPLVPAPVVAQAWRGGSRQARLVHLLRPCEIEDMTAAQARKVGELVGASKLDDITDVAVVEVAIRLGDGGPIVTSNEAHIRQVADAAGVNLLVEAI
ncbi:MAG: twitching motility protein PilT [Acidimicrobiales bacterium]